VKSGTVLPLAAITASSADPDSHKLEVRVFGDGSLPFLLETAGGSLQISWNASSASGAVNQKGNEEYTVTKWVRADRA
jgi:hypothetical protein